MARRTQVDVSTRRSGRPDEDDELPDVALGNAARDRVAVLTQGVDAVLGAISEAVGSE